MKRIAAFFLVLFIGFQVQAQKPVKQKPLEGSLLWEVSGNGLTQPSYLFGTYHLIGKSFLDTLPNVLAQLKKSHTVVGEIVMEDEMALAQKLMPLMMLKGSSLDKILTASEFAEVDSFIKGKMGMGLSMMNQFKPAAVQLTIVSVLAPKDISASNPALDMYFQKEAKAAGKKVEAFETAEQQAGILFDMPVDRQKETLLKTVRESDKMIRESALLFSHYKQQNIKALQSDFDKNDDFTPEEMNNLLMKRNRDWMTRIPGMMKQEPVFIAVGAAHLLGQEGLITLLRNAGYQVRPLPLK